MMQTLTCPMCKRTVLRTSARGPGIIEGRCHNRHCTARPLLRWEIGADGRAVLRALDRARRYVVA